jgi:poly-gamma-glutamate capsule biosynthesis protein CapA/YwtB (metallophosphatase superfamily)
MNIFKIISILIIGLLISGSKSKDLYKSAEIQLADDTAKDSTSSITLSFVGDLMCHSTQFNYARVGPDTFDFKPVFAEVKDILESADFAVGNLETVIGGKEIGYTGYPIFNTPEDFLDGLKYAGFDILITANNHSLDKGKKGVLNTLDNIRSYGMEPNGTYTSREDQDSIRIYSKNGISFAMVGYSYTFNGNAETYLINKIDTTSIKKDIQKAKDLNPDFIVAYLHTGIEYEREPSKAQIELTNKVIEYGADIIIQSHPHVAQKIEYFESENSNLQKGFVAYSLGNFISNQRWRYSDTGPILNFEISKNFKTGKVELTELNYLPTWVFKGSTERGREYIVLPSETVFYTDKPEYLSEDDLTLMKESFFDTIEIMEPKYSKTSHLKTLKFDYTGFKERISNLVLLMH